MSKSSRRLAAALAVVATVWVCGQSQPAGQGQRTVQAITPQSAAELRTWALTVDGLVRDGSLRVARSEADPMVAGRRIERLNQFVRGVRVWGGDIVRQMSGSVVVSMTGNLYPGIDIDPAPRITAADAADSIARASGADVRGIPQPELVVLPRDNGVSLLVYQAQAWSMAGPTVYFVDARTGDIAWQYSNRQSQSAVHAGKGVLNDDKKVSMRGANGVFTAEDLLRPPSIRTYDMRSNLTRTKLVLSGLLPLSTSDLASTTADVWTDGASVDAQTYAAWTYDYYYKRFGRRGLDNADAQILSIVHPVSRDTALSASASDSDFYVNAFWDGRRMVYGEGIPATLTYGGQHYNYFSGALDIVAHELTHGVTQYTSSLTYLNESGALNEAFSDMMGTSVEIYYQPVRGRGNYLIGEDMITPGGFRSMADPIPWGQPDHYSLRYLGSQDNGGVHINSGIANNAFYLAIESGTNRTSRLAVSGVGAANREQIEKVFYRAFTQMLPSGATFAMARAATIQSARDLYGAGSAAERAVTQAWTAVGVN